MSKHRLSIRWLIGSPQLRSFLVWTPGIIGRWKMWRRRWTTCAHCGERINSVMSFGGAKDYCDERCYAASQELSHAD